MHFLLLLLFGPLFFAFVAGIYAAPFVVAIADAAGRPGTEWTSGRRRIAWIAALCVSVAGAIMLLGHLVPVAYALRVPRSVSSEAARVGAVAARRRARVAFAASIVVFGPLWLAVGWNNSEDAMISGLALSTAVVVLCALAVYDHVTPRSIRKRALLVGIVIAVSACAGWVNREAWFNSCYRRCGSLPRDTVWVVPAFAAAGGAVIWFATRPRPQPVPMSAPTSG